MKFNFLLISVVLVLGSVLRAEMIPLEIHTKEHDMELVRNAVRGGFMDVVESPTVKEEFDYMQIHLVPNGFITIEEYYCDIFFYETVDGLLIKAVPVDISTGSRVEVDDFATRKGVYMMIEGAALELDFEVEARPMVSADMGGFTNYNDELRRVYDLTGGTPTITFASYPEQGRFYHSTGSNGGYVQLVEDPSSPNVVSMLVIGQPSGVSDREVKGWLREIHQNIMRREGPKLQNIFYENTNTNFNTSAFNVYISDDGSNHTILLQETGGMRASKGL